MLVFTIGSSHPRIQTPWDGFQKDLQRDIHAVQKLRFTIEPPFSRLRSLGGVFLAILSPDKVGRAIELYRQGMFTLGRASEEAAIPMASFLEILARLRIPVHYTLEDLEYDRKTAKLLWSR